jgi:hypothetical protein
MTPGGADGQDEGHSPQAICGNWVRNQERSILKQRILIVLGLVVALLALYTLFFSVRPERSGTAAGGWASALATQAGADEREAEAEADADTEAAVKKSGPTGKEFSEVREPESWGSDPFVRDWLLVNELREMQLKAITLGGERAFALINDQILEEGDMISGKRITRIESDKVIMEQGGRTFTLVLGE